MLCTTCGRFGHYKEGCTNKVKEAEAKGKEGNPNGDSMKQQDIGGGADGPWRVVQKQRRNRKVNTGRNNSTAALNEFPAKINDQP
ncbi:hypothetical protein A2U01_0066073, partial [Trifolium medium]|nr:hypothetical protein [Trifolium medium]